MHQFIQGTDQAYAALEREARFACVVFQDQEMPAGTNPERARIGFEIDPENDMATLFVDRGLSYDGPVHAIWEWFMAGEKRFRHFADLIDWIRRELTRGYAELGQEGHEGGQERTGVHEGTRGA